jgi:hypothetical protein
MMTRRLWLGRGVVIWGDTFRGPNGPCMQHQDIQAEEIADGGPYRLRRTKGVASSFVSDTRSLYATQDIPAEAIADGGGLPREADEGHGVIVDGGEGREEVVRVERRTQVRHLRASHEFTREFVTCDCSTRDGQRLFQTLMRRE